MDNSGNLLYTVDIGIQLNRGDEVEQVKKKRFERLREFATSVIHTKCGRVVTLTLSAVIGIVVYVGAHYTGVVNTFELVCKNKQTNNITFFSYDGRLRILR